MTISRRSFFKRLVGAAALAPLLAVLPGCKKVKSGPLPNYPSVSSTFTPVGRWENIKFVESSPSMYEAVLPAEMMDADIVKVELDHMSATITTFDEKGRKK